MIAPVRTRSSVLAVLALASALPVRAHDLERTQVAIALSADGSFVIDVSNDPAWLKLRVESIPGPFVDRVVLFVDGHEVRPTSDEFVAEPAIATHRLRGTLPRDARVVRWYYGLVIDPYPLTVRHANGRIQTEVVGGDAWSGEINVAGEFRATSRWPIYAIVLLFAAAIAIRLSSLRRA
jgi:hypothetical protein